MRTVKIESGEIFEIKSLKWSDVRRLAAENLTPETIMRNDAKVVEEKSGEAINRVLALALGEEKAAWFYEQGSMRDTIAVYKAVWKETRGDEDEEKN